MYIKDTNIYYCFIDPNYLRLVYDSEKLKAGKYAKRPFVYIPEFSIAIAIPEKTNYKRYKSKFNFYFNNDKNYLDISSMIYVDKNHITLTNSWNVDKDKLKKLNEIYARKKEIFDLIDLLFNHMSKSLSFEWNHMHILRSKNLIKQ